MRDKKKILTSAWNGESCRHRLQDLLRVGRVQARDLSHLGEAGGHLRGQPSEAEARQRRLLLLLLVVVVKLL